MTCGKLTLHAKPFIHSEVLSHILITAFLCGLWLPILILVWISNKNPMRCQTCGEIEKELVKIPIPSAPKPEEPPKPPKEKWVPTETQKAGFVVLGSLALIGLVIGVAWVIKH